MANLHKHASKELRADYLSDATKLRVLAAKLVKPAHVCSHNESAGAARACEVAPLDGAGLVALLERWVALGHIIVDESAKNRGVNVTAVIESYSTQLDQWMTWRCGELRALLEKLARKLGKVGCVVAGCPRVAGKLSAFATTRTQCVCARMVLSSRRCEDTLQVRSQHLCSHLPALASRVPQTRSSGCCIRQPSLTWWIARSFGPSLARLPR